MNRGSLFKPPYHQCGDCGDEDTSTAIMINSHTFNPSAQLLAQTAASTLGISNSVLVPLGVLFGLAALLLFFGRIPISYNLLNLTVRWRTTLLTALAFTLVISLLTVMLAFVNGMYQLTENSGHPENVVVLAEGSTDESFSNLGFSDIGDIENQAGILRPDGRPLLSRETYLVVNQPIPNAPPGGPQRRFLQLRGIVDPNIAAQVHQIVLYEGGGWFSESGVQEVDSASATTAVEVVVGEGIARELGSSRTEAELAAAANSNRLDVGDVFSLSNRPWKVVGVMQSSGSTFDSEVWAKQSLIGPMFGKETYTALVARTADAESAATLKNFLNNDYKKAAVSALSEPEYYAGLSSTNRQFLFGIIFVAIVMAIGGVFGVMNTMFAAIGQRTKDIGVLRLIGYRRRQILISFLLESLAIAFIGGLLGCAVGMLADGWTATSILSAGQGGGGKFIVLKLAVDANTIAVGLLLALVMGLAGGLLPSLSAMRLSALDALR